MRVKRANRRTVAKPRAFRANFESMSFSAVHALENPLCRSLSYEPKPAALSQRHDPLAEHYAKLRPDSLPQRFCDVPPYPPSAVRQTTSFSARCPLRVPVAPARPG